MLIKTHSFRTTRPAPSHHLLAEERSFKAERTLDHPSTPRTCQRRVRIQGQESAWGFVVAQTDSWEFTGGMEQFWIFTSMAHLTCSSRLLMVTASTVTSSPVTEDRDCNCFSMDIFCSA